MNQYWRLTAWAVISIVISSSSLAQELPDIRSIEPDLVVPALSTGEPLPGLRVKSTLAAWQHTEVYHVLHLPHNWTKRSERLPVIVEWAGNGGYSNQFGDSCDGRPEGCKLGYGLSAGQDFIWLCLPYLNAASDQLALKWWGDAPTYDPEPTLNYCRAAVQAICTEYHGDPERVVLCGFSRGALACNYLGLHDEATAQLWCGFLTFSHYDGVRNWPYPQSDRSSAIDRLKRLGSRPQFICSEGRGVAAIQDYLRSEERSKTVNLGQLTFADIGFRNHNDAWVLRPCQARIEARLWLANTVGIKPKSASGNTE